MAEQLTVQGLHLVLDKTPKGPLLSTAEAATEALAWLINSALAGRLHGLREALEHGEDIRYEGLSALRDSAGNYELSGDFFESRMTVPRDVILEVLATIQSLRVPQQERIKPAPVIVPAVRVERAPIGGRTDLPTAWEDLERRAAELDTLMSRDRTAAHKAEESAKRRLLLLDLRDKRLFDESFVAIPALVKIQEYRNAGMSIIRYLGSQERFDYNPEAAIQPVIGSPISLDWFRRNREPGPSHLSPFAWLAFLENMLTRNEVVGDEGEILVRADDWWSLLWRADDGEHPCLVSASRSSEHKRHS